MDSDQETDTYKENPNLRSTNGYVEKGSTNLS